LRIYIDVSRTCANHTLRESSVKHYYQYLFYGAVTWTCTIAPYLGSLLDNLLTSQLAISQIAD